jgi:hypothetical protein
MRVEGGARRKELRGMFETKGVCWPLADMPMGKVWMVLMVACSLKRVGTLGRSRVDAGGRTRNWVGALAEATSKSSESVE